ncbi:hypothetical protein HZS_2893 [Henneguya salminicola]|nr:hypothetical protein HZS_2893 [Henneguya salminicola]
MEKYYIHKTVNYFIAFRDPVSGSYTNTIEESWNTLKYQISHKKMRRYFHEGGNVAENILRDLLGKFEWRRKHAEDLWNVS